LIISVRMPSWMKKARQETKPFAAAGLLWSRQCAVAVCMPVINRSLFKS